MRRRRRRRGGEGGEEKEGCLAFRCSPDSMILLQSCYK
jgi:hypothetical protein